MSTGAISTGGSRGWPFRRSARSSPSRCTTSPTPRSSGHLGRAPLDALRHRDVHAVDRGLAGHLPVDRHDHRGVAERRPGQARRGRARGRRRLLGRRRVGRRDVGRGHPHRPAHRRPARRPRRHRVRRYRLHPDLGPRPALPLPVLRGQRAPHRPGRHQDPAADRGRGQRRERDARDRVRVRAARRARRVRLGHGHGAGAGRGRLRVRVQAVAVPADPARPR